MTTGGEPYPVPTDTISHELAVEEATGLTSEAGVPRTHRTIRRHFAEGRLTSVLADSELDERYMIDRPSIENWFAEL